jgi:hypothetical protein
VSTARTVRQNHWEHLLTAVEVDESGDHTMSAQRPDDTDPSPPPDLDEEIALLTR